MVHDISDKVGGGSNRACGVARIDDDDGPNSAAALSLFKRTVQLVHIKRPVVVLVQVVAHRLEAELRERRRVQWVLRDRDHTACTDTRITLYYMRLYNAADTDVVYLNLAF